MRTTSSKVTLLIPVRRADGQLHKCLASVMTGTVVPQIILMDCTAEAGALNSVRGRYPQIRIFDMQMNPGRAHAVNTGIHITRTPYVMTLSPGLAVGKHCVEKLCEALDRDSSLLSAQGKILSAEDPSRLAGAGWLLDLAARPVIRGKGARAISFAGRKRIAAAQMDCAVYRMEYLEVTGLMDERYYARLEDLDLGIRGCLAGFGNLYEPAAVCRETGKSSLTDFYRQLEVGNLVYLRYKYGFKELRLPWKKPEAGQEAALERGRMLCFMAELEMMEKEELGMTVTKQTLPEEFYMEIRKDGPSGVYPLYVGERDGGMASGIPDYLRMYAGMAKGTAEKLRNLCS